MGWRVEDIGQRVEGIEIKFKWSKSVGRCWLLDTAVRCVGMWENRSSDNVDDTTS